MSNPLITNPDRKHAHYLRFVVASSSVVLAEMVGDPTERSVLLEAIRYRAYLARVNRIAPDEIVIRHVWTRCYSDPLPGDSF